MYLTESFNSRASSYLNKTRGNRLQLWKVDEIDKKRPEGANQSTCFKESEHVH